MQVDKVVTNWIPANWPAPVNVHAGITTRQSGFSNPPFNSMNLALHVGDEAGKVFRNRKLLRKKLDLPNDPVWLQQVHGNEVVIAQTSTSDISADGAWTDQPETVCAVLVADCVPLLLCNRSGTMIAAIHVGWRGLCAHIIDTAIQKFQQNNDNLLAWIGPHIGTEHYQVRDDVRDICIDSITDMAAQAFIPVSTGNWHADLELLVRLNLSNCGVSQIYHCNRCTYQDADDFFSYRRASRTGRMACLIWMDDRIFD